MKVKTPCLIFLIIMPLTYIYNFSTLQVGIVVLTTILKLF
jgi:hypothetical protein